MEVDANSLCAQPVVPREQVLVFAELCPPMYITPGHCAHLCTHQGTSHQECALCATTLLAISAAALAIPAVSLAIPAAVLEQPESVTC